MGSYLMSASPVRALSLSTAAPVADSESAELAPLLQAMGEAIATRLGLPRPSWEVTSIAEFPYCRLASCRAIGGGQARPFVIKIFSRQGLRFDPREAKEEARAYYEKLEWLSAALAKTPGTAAPRPLALSDMAVAVEAAPGLRLDEVFRRGALGAAEAAFRGAGRWLRTLAALPPPNQGAEETFAAELAHVERSLEAVARFSPARADRVGRWRALAARLGETIRPRLTGRSSIWCHADFIAVNLFFQAPGLFTAIDVAGTRPGLWPRDLASLRYDLFKMRLTSLAGALRANSCWSAVLEGRGLEPRDLENEEFRFYWARELAGHLHIYLRRRAEGATPGLGAGLIFRATERALEKLARGETGTANHATA